MHYHVMNGLIPFVLSNYDELLYVRTTIWTRPLSNVFLFETSERIAVRVMKCDAFNTPLALGVMCVNVSVLK